MQAPKTDSDVGADRDPASCERPTFALRAQQQRDAARAEASAEIAAIQQHAAARLSALRQQYALELAAAEAEARRKPRWLPWALGATLTLAGAVGGNWWVSSSATLADTAPWADISPKHEVRLALRISDAVAEREQARQKRRPVYRRRSTHRSDRPCRDDPFDPMNDCL